MKLVIISDTHGRHDELGTLRGDVLIHCGDSGNGFSGHPYDLDRLDAWFGQQEFERILCIGAGYVGGPTMAVIAKHCPDVQVVVADVNAERVAAWQSGEPPIFEPGLRDVVRASLGRNLRFSGDVEPEIAQAEMIFVSVNTPTKTFGQGAGRAADLQHWEKTARAIRQHARRPVIVVEKSTLPVRTAEAMERIFRTRRPEQRFEVLSNPEFLAEGTAMADLERPDRVLIGGAETPAGQAAMRELVDVYARWVPRERILDMFAQR